MNIGEQMRALRLKRKLSQTKLSEQTGVAISTISEIESGLRNVEMATVSKLLTALGGTIKIA